MTMPRPGTKGFTLIELLIVLAIMAVLAAVIIPSVRSGFGKGVAESYDTDQRILQVVTNTFFQEEHILLDRETPTPEQGQGHFYPTYKVKVESSSISDNGKSDADVEATGFPTAAWGEPGGPDTQAWLDIHLLVEVGLLTEIPPSAHPVNRYLDASYDTGSNTVTLTPDDSTPSQTEEWGSYGWYVDSNGAVKSYPTFEGGGHIYP